jgi:heme exporter protein B
MVRLISQISALLWKEFTLEFRNRNALNGIVLYVFSTIFIVYQSFRSVPDVPVWNALLWMIILFSSVNAANKTFQNDDAGRQYYIYLLADPVAVILSKILYNMILLSFLSLVSAAFYGIVLGNPVQQYGNFIFVLLLGSMGLSSLLTMISAISFKAGNALGMIAVLGFPVMIPLLITLIKASKGVADGLPFNTYSKYLYTMAGLDILVIALSVILFPYLWRD